ncbi:hypothetical protein [Bradyrhizobium sp. RDI18]|uniref:hypothetical protein n=1 Tax=Bradyrhizobium sp. RDI18 TaxID=3367400 RepID=UPI0037229019
MPAEWLPQAERDAAYDNNAAVKSSAALIAERSQASETLRASRKSFLAISRKFNREHNFGAAAIGSTVLNVGKSFQGKPSGKRLDGRAPQLPR